MCSARNTAKITFLSDGQLILVMDQFFLAKNFSYQGIQSGIISPLPVSIDDYAFSMQDPLTVMTFLIFISQSCRQTRLFLPSLQELDNL